MKEKLNHLLEEGRARIAAVKSETERRQIARFAMQPNRAGRSRHRRHSLRQQGGDHSGKQIAAAAEEQSAVAETISESVTRVRDIGEQSASASQQLRKGVRPRVTMRSRHRCVHHPRR